jgi:hypothetical protein
MTMKPTWWLLYIIGLSLVGLLGLVEISVPRGGLQGVLEIIVVIGSFVLMALWLRRNRVAMELEEDRRRRGTVGHGRRVPALPSTQPAGQNGSRVASPLSTEITGHAPEVTSGSWKIPVPWQRGLRARLRTARRKT